MMNEHRSKPIRYEILIDGHLDTHWQSWFEDLTIVHTDDGCTVLDGPIQDQTALHGVLRRINNLGLTLISVNPQASIARR